MPPIDGAFNPQFFHRKYGKLFYDISPALTLADDLIIAADGTPDPIQNPNAVYIGATDAGYDFSAQPTNAEEEIDEAETAIEVAVESVAAQISFEALEVLDLEKMAALIPHANYSENTVAGAVTKRITAGGSRIILPTRPVAVISPEKTGGFAGAILWAGYNSGAHQMQFQKKNRSKQAMVVKGLQVQGRADGDRIYRTFKTIPIPVIITVTPVAPGGNVGVPYSKIFAASGGAAPYSWVRTLGALPTGLALNAITGELSGTPTTAALFNYTLQATDRYGRVTVAKAFAHTVVA